MFVPFRPRAAIVLTLAAAAWIAGCGGTSTEIPTTTPPPETKNGVEPGPPTAVQVKPIRP